MSLGTGKKPELLGENALNGPFFEIQASDVCFVSCFKFLLRAGCTRVLPDGYLNCFVFAEDISCVINLLALQLFLAHPVYKEANRFSASQEIPRIFAFCGTRRFITAFTKARNVLIRSPPPPVALRPHAGHGLLILEVSRSHTTTHHSR